MYEQTGKQRLSPSLTNRNPLRQLEFPDFLEKGNKTTQRRRSLALPTHFFACPLLKGNVCPPTFLLALYRKGIFVDHFLLPVTRNDFESCLPT